MDIKPKESVKTFRNLFTRVVPDKRDKIRKDIDGKEIEESKDKAWDEWEELGKRAGRITKN